MSEKQTPRVAIFKGEQDEWPDTVKRRFDCEVAKNNNFSISGCDERRIYGTEHHCIAGKDGEGIGGKFAQHHAFGRVGRILDTLRGRSAS